MNVKRYALLALIMLVLCSVSVAAVGTPPNYLRTDLFWTFDSAQYTAPTLRDLTPNQTNLTAYGGTVANVDGIFRQSFFFNGTRGYAKATKRETLTTDDSWTFVFWINKTAAVGDNDPILGLTAQDGGYAQGYILLYAGSSSYCGATTPAMVIENAAGSDITVFCPNRTLSSEIAMWAISYNATANTCKWWMNETQLTVTFHTANCDILSGGLTTGGNNSKLTLGNFDGSYAQFFKGNIDEFSKYNYELSQDEISYEYNSRMPGFAQQYPFSQNITLVASDEYNGSSLSSFSALINGTTYVTTGGTLTTNITASDDSSYNVTVSADGYFNRTYLDVNSTSLLEAELHQAELNIIARDVLTNEIVSSYVAQSSLQNKTATSGLVSFNITNGTYQINITATGYDFASETFTLTSLEVENRTVYLTPQFNIRVLKESDGSAFQVNQTNSTKLTVYCPNTTIEREFNRTTNNNTLALGLSCSWLFMKLDVVYPGGSYFRTRIPAPTENPIDFYAIDLNAELAVQIILNLNDLTGEFVNGTAILKKFVGGTEESIIEQTFDLENRVVLYLIKDQLYTLSIRSQITGQTRNLGYFLADAAGEKTITLPSIPFLPDAVVGGTVNWDWSANMTPVIRFAYNDTAGVTSNVTFFIRNGTNISHIIYNTTSYNVSVATFTFMTSNTSYLACFEAYHPEIDLLKGCKAYGPDDEMGTWAGFTQEERDEIQMWISIIFLVLLGLGVGYIHIGVGLGLVGIFMWVFMAWEWLDFGSPWVNYTVLSIVGFFAVVEFIFEVSRK